VLNAVHRDNVRHISFVARVVRQDQGSTYRVCLKAGTHRQEGCSFECVSHRRRREGKRRAAAPHDVDVWCVRLCGIEPMDYSMQRSADHAPAVRTRAPGRRLRRVRSGYIRATVDVKKAGGKEIMESSRSIDHTVGLGTME
jgi:hypothetical protein